MAQKLSYLQVKTPKEDETKPEAAAQIFSTLLPHHIGLFKRLYTTIPTFSFEIYLLSQTIYYYVTTPTSREKLVSSLISSAYPSSAVIKTTDPMDLVFKSKHVSLGELKTESPFYLPIKTYADFASVDPLAALIGYLAKQPKDVSVGIQILVTPASFPWGHTVLASGKSTETDESGKTRVVQNTSQAMLSKKAGFAGGKAVIRIVSGSQTSLHAAHDELHNIAGTYAALGLAEGNQLTLHKPLFFKAGFGQKILARATGFFERRKQVFNAAELATLWHPSGALMAGIKNIKWGKTLPGEPPPNLPISDGLTEEQRKEINFFAKTDFKNQETIFGIKTADRRKHLYTLGKTGSGKSTLIANMAIDDIRKDRGVGIIDPHGDLCDTILEYIPKRRIQDVVYIEPFDSERPVSINVLEIRNKQQKDLVSSGIVAIFAKLYADSWGPRLEYILRNTILTLLEVPGTTLIDVLNILSQPKFRARIVEQIQDPVIKAFWTQEFEKMSDKLRTEAVAPIQNKVGQFVSSKMIRNIIGSPKSTIDLQEIMDSGKILILNLSQGKLGEDNAALLGAMIITQIQLAAMNRAFMKEEDRRDFFLYVDEFQNFATSSFIKILSEARKYRLALTLTNQYILQLDEGIRDAIFGNVGTLASFVVGATDAEPLSREFGGLYTPNDLVSLGKHEIVVKLCIDNMTHAPFPARTLPLPTLINSNRDKIIKLSKERYGRNVEISASEAMISADISEQPKQEDRPKNEVRRENKGGNKKRPQGAQGGKPANKRPQTNNNSPQRSTNQNQNSTPIPPANPNPDNSNS